MLGSKGLVGSSLLRFLNKKNSYNVIGSTRQDADLFSFESTKKLLEDEKPDVLINAAARVGGIYANNTKRTEFLLENLKINLNILEASINIENIKIINLGSSCIYPLNAEDPITEDAYMTGILEPTNSPYAMAKLTAIELGKSLKSQYDKNVINLMPTNLYGPNDNFSELDSHVIPGLISRMYKSKIENNESFQIWGTGNPLREFLYVDDLSSAIDFIISNEVNNELLNVGSGEEISIKDLSEKIKKIIDFKGELVFDNSKPDGNPRKLLDSNLINSLGWKSSTNLDEGLELTYKWFVENFKNIRK
ncbi:GDP-L-fucose synthase [Acidimicrobiaceae bacterium]|nr:GDP-L-fucose synthase [Acidimicrobiaceae bacterium]